MALACASMAQAPPAPFAEYLRNSGQQRRSSRDAMKGLHSSAAVGAVLLSISYSLSLFNRTAGTVLIVALAASFSRNIDEIAAIATVFFWAYALLQIPAGVLADVLGPRRLAVLGGVVTGIGSFAFAAAQTVGTAVYARGVVAAGCSVVSGHAA